MKIIKIHNITYYFLFILFLSGYIKVGLIILFIVLFHELGHIIVAHLFKYNIESVIIYPFGGITLLNKDLNTPVEKEIILALAGIINQLILLALIYILPFSMSFKTCFYKYNLSIMLFNILPIIPLDGSIVMFSILNKFKSFKEAYFLHVIISIIFIIGYLLFNYWYSLNNYLLIGLFIYKIYLAIKNYKYIYNKFLLERFLNNYDFKYISMKKGNLDILKIDTYQYFQIDNKIVGEEKILRERFDNRPYI